MRIVVHLVLAVVLWSCAAPVAPPPERPLSDAERVLAQGASLPRAARAEFYLDALLERLPPPQITADLERLATARQLVARLEEGDGEPLHLTLPRVRRFEWLSAALRTALAAGEVVAEERLADLQPASREQVRQVTLLRAALSERLGDHEGAAKLLIAASTTPNVAMSERIWRSVARVDPRRLTLLAGRATSAQEGAWWSLALTQYEALSTRKRLEAWRDWRQTHRGHLASQAPPPALEALQSAPRGIRIALLVPLSGPLASAGQAIRDGFTAAYLMAGPGAEDSLAVVDTALHGAVDAYRRAVARGAELVVGPLRKEAVAAIAALPPSVPTVALNAIDGRAPRLVQLAYAIEDEATAIAQAIGTAGLERVLLLGVSAPWSERAEERLRAELGTLVQPPEIIDAGEVAGVRSVTGAVGEGLGVAASQARREELGRLLRRELAFAPWQRDDIDAIVALVGAAQMTALTPALDFHSARDLPLYVPSTALRGVGLGRLRGVRACGVPWQPREPAIAGTLRRSFSGTATVAALQALGVDAFRVGHRFVQPQRSALLPVVFGSTGILTIGADEFRVAREVHWSRIVNGRFEPWSPELDVAQR
ncbi:MAG: penicillin-binding protein activator [Gammaproteobacteria bacterium]|nr:penicillin-binding protein activator [Gammaproteobacteria bacterium]